MRRQRKNTRAIRKNPERPDATETPATEPGLRDEPGLEVEVGPALGEVEVAEVEAEAEAEVGPESVVIGLDGGCDLGLAG